SEAEAMARTACSKVDAAEAVDARNDGDGVGREVHISAPRLVHLHGLQSRETASHALEDFADVARAGRWIEHAHALERTGIAGAPRGQSLRPVEEGFAD